MILNKDKSFKEISGEIRKIKHATLGNRQPLVYGEWCNTFLDKLTPASVYEPFDFKDRSTTADYLLNSPLHLNELIIMALRTVKTHSAPGLDGIYYVKLQHLPIASKLHLVQVSNKISLEEVIPKERL